MEALKTIDLKCDWFADSPRLAASRNALDGLSLSLGNGEWCALVGDNGIGKSTFLHALAGTCPNVTGTILVLGKELRPRHIRQRFELGVQFVRQEISCRAHWRWDDVKRFAFDSRKGLHVREAVEDFLKIARKAKILGSSTSVLSPRLARFLASALSCPSVLLLDEIGSIFPEIDGADVYRFVCSVAPSAAVVFVEHDLELAGAFATTTVKFREKQDAPGASFPIIHDVVSKNALKEDRPSETGIRNSYVDEDWQVVLPLLRGDRSGADHLRLAKRASNMSYRSASRISEHIQTQWPEICGKKRIEHFSGGMKVLMFAAMEIVMHGTTDSSHPRFRHVHEKNRSRINALVSDAKTLINE